MLEIIYDARRASSLVIRNPVPNGEHSAIVCL